MTGICCGPGDGGNTNPTPYFDSSSLIRVEYSAVVVAINMLRGVCLYVRSMDPECRSVYSRRAARFVSFCRVQHPCPLTLVLPAVTWSFFFFSFLYLQSDCIDLSIGEPGSGTVSTLFLHSAQSGYPVLNTCIPGSVHRPSIRPRDIRASALCRW